MRTTPGARLASMCACQIEQQLACTVKGNDSQTGGGAAGSRGLPLKWPGAGTAA
jgi:hypothetical protein